jgi:capsular exopolysaccharide synthesis family protein
MTLLRRHGLWLLLATFTGIIGALLVYELRPIAYSSSAQVDVESHVVALPPNMTTETQVATSGVVVTPTASVMGMSTTSMRPHLSAKVTGTANVLSIACTMPTPAAAQRCATAAAAAYISFRNMVGSPKIAQARNPLQVTLVTAASLPTAPAGPGKRILLPIGAILGLLLGIGAMIVRDHFDDRVRDRADLERCLDAPVVAEVPRVGRRAGSPASVFSRTPHSPAAEAYRYLRARLDPLVASADGGVVLLVAGPRRLEGRTSVAANLATALAYAGDKVILVDADLKNPMLSKVFGTWHRPGLGDLLAGRALLEEAAIPTYVPGLRLVTAGEAIGRTSDTLEVSRLGQGFARMKEVADVVIVDSAPVLEASDALTLASVSDLVVVVADVRRTRRGDASSAAEQIRAVGLGTIVGVLNGTPRSVRQRGTRPNASHDRVWVSSSPRVPAILGSLVPPRGPNGQGVAPHTAAGAGGGAKNNPPSGHEPDAEE